MSEITADVCHRCLADLWDNRLWRPTWIGCLMVKRVQTEGRTMLKTNYPPYNTVSIITDIQRNIVPLWSCPGVQDSGKALYSFSPRHVFFFFFFLTWEPSHPAASQLNASDCSMVLFWRKSSGLEDQIESQKWRLSSSWWVYNWE